MPALGRQAAEQRFAARFLVEMKALRVELRGEFLDVVGGEGERSQFAPLPDREPARPRSIECLAASSSRCIGCGSNSAANASISSRVTWRGPNEPKGPGLKSSKVSVMN